MNSQDRSELIRKYPIQIITSIPTRHNMSLSWMFFTFCVIFLYLSPLTESSSTGEETRTAYELLGEYNFPTGILPKGVTGYRLDPNTGEFEAYLNGTCSFSLEGSYQLTYKSTIGGHISKNRLTNMSGVSVKVLLFWLNIVEVERSGDELDFSVGITSASFPLDNFSQSPQCGCGLNCNDLPLRKLKLKLKPNPSVSSI